MASVTLAPSVTFAPLSLYRSLAKKISDRFLDIINCLRSQLMYTVYLVCLFACWLGPKFLKLFEANVFKL